MPQNKFDVSESGVEEIQSQYSISRGQKLAVIVLAFFAILTMGFWSFQFKKSLIISAQPGSGQEADFAGSSDSGIDEQSEEDLRVKDTDGDGLNDWDELNTYKTSPYLEDSDSDSFSDKTELDSDNDPNCPIGRNCFSATVQAPDEAGTNLTEDPKTTEQESVPLPVKEGEKTAEIKKLEQTLYTDGNVAELRAMLIEKGMDKAMLDQVSDTELLELFRETVSGN
jgi:hypothetical protein